MPGQDDILAVAARLFRERGYAATSIRDLGAALGTTSAALYYHFKSKEDVLLAVVREGVRRVSDRVRAAMAAEEDLYAQVRAGLRAHLVTCLTHQDFAAVVLHEVRGLRPEARRQAVAERDRYEQLWADVLQRGREAGILRPGVDAHLLRLLGFGAMNWVTVWYRPDGPYTPEAIADAFLQLMADGVMVPAGPTLPLT